MDDPRLTVLLDTYLDGALSTEQRAELEGILLASPVARAQFWVHASLHGLMREAAELKWGKTLAEAEALGSPTGKPPESSAPGLRGLVFGRTWRWVGRAAVVLVALGVAAWLALRPRDVSKEPAPRAGSPAEPFARVTLVANARWSEPERGYQPGAGLSVGWVKLVLGAAQLEFASGAKVILEGPVEFEIIGSSQARCRAGRISVQVSEASRGFQVNSPMVSVVDLGTEFGLFVPEARPTEVHVFEGKVKASWGTGVQQSQVLSAGEALRVKPGKAITTRAKRGAFLTEQELARRAAAAQDTAPLQPADRR